MESSTTLQSLGGPATGALLAAAAGEAASTDAEACALDAVADPAAGVWLPSFPGDAAGWTRAASFEHAVVKTAARTSAADRWGHLTSRLDGHLELLA
jgi:hypothetical protein